MMSDALTEDETDAPFAHEEDGRMVLWVRAGSGPHRVSGSILKNVQEGRTVSARAVGAGAVNQAIKGCAIARQICVKEGQELQVTPVFESIRIEGVERTAMCLNITIGPSVSIH